MTAVTNIVRHFAGAVARRLLPARPWHKDLCDYYGVTPEQALELGTRANGRRPNLPGSVTTHAVSGRTFEEIWESRRRTTPEEIHSFYKDMGAWAAFRQVVFHRGHSYAFLAAGIGSGDRICEYGAGVAPVCFWLVEHLPRTTLTLTIVDVSSEHLVFGEWRLRRRIEELKTPATLRVREVLPDQLPLDDEYDVITILDVYEHLHNPLQVTIHICDHLRSGGTLWENYIRSDTVDGANLPIAQQERPKVFDYLRRHCKLISGADPHGPDVGATRCWRRL